MKKIFNYILGLAILALATVGFTACNTDSEEFREMGYNTLSVTYNPIALNQQYRATLDGQEVGYGLILPKSIETGELEIFRVSDGASVFKEEVSTAEPIEFIHPVDKELALYENGKYMEFTPTVIFSGDASRYGVRFKEWNLTAGELNYIPLSELPGDMTIVDTQNENAVLFSYDVTQNCPSQLNVMQLAETEFLNIPEDTEPNPEEGFFKVRFLYTQDAFPDYPELKLVLYVVSTDWTQYSDAVSTITLKAGELSEYVVINGNYFGTKYVYGLYDLVNPYDESYYIVNNMTDMETMIDFYTYGSLYKFSTVRFTDPQHLQHDGVSATLIDALSTKW